jgi:malonate-semialdehyde dehydrogenase (acetylating) / methylmalonate-semialdehyde dehydrogenase
VAKFASGIPHLLKGEYSENVSRGIDTYSIRQPLGVVAGITPFNFPAMVPMWMFPIAIACGNAFVLKPSEKDPSTSNRLAELALRAGLPPGVLNVVHGGVDAVNALLAHQGIAAVSFVGSTPVARYVYETAAAHGKRVQALGGAKNHLVVLPDADLDAAADALVSAAYGSAGERCMAVSVAVAVGDVGDALRERLVERIGKLATADGRDAGTDMGPLVTAEHLDKVSGYVGAGADAGAELVVDGRGIDVPGRPGGYFIAPTLLDHVRPDMTVYTDEIFGPVLVMLRVDTLEDAIELINSGQYGNGVSLFTASGVAARRFQHAVQVGMIGLNVPIPVPIPYYPFGGWKNSLFGDSGQYGEDGVRFFTQRKVITTRWAASSSGGVDLRFPGGHRETVA